MWWLSHLSNFAHKKHLSFYYARKLTLDDARISYERQAKENLESISEIKKEQAIVKEEIQKNTSEEDLWDIEFESFRESPLYGQIEKIKDTLYNNSGVTRRWDGEEYRLLIGADVLATADAKELITISGSGKDEKITLTPKGKFFMAKYLESRSRG